MRLFILVADDDEDDAFFLVRALAQAGAERGLTTEVSVVRDGQEALHRVFKSPPLERWGLVILDLKMPRLNGLEALRAIRESPGHRGLPIVLFTASDEQRDRSEAELLGVSRYLRKPADTDRFVDVAREALDLALAAAPPDA